MAYQEITIKKRTRKTGTSSNTRTTDTGAKAPQKPRRQNITRNNTTPSKVCPRCGGTGRVKS